MPKNFVILKHLYVNKYNDSLLYISRLNLIIFDNVKRRVFFMNYVHVLGVYGIHELWNLSDRKLGVTHMS